MAGRVNVDCLYCLFHTASFAALSRHGRTHVSASTRMMQVCAPSRTSLPPPVVSRYVRYVRLLPFVHSFRHLPPSSECSPTIAEERNTSMFLTSLSARIIDEPEKKRQVRKKKREREREGVRRGGGEARIIDDILDRDVIIVTMLNEMTPSSGYAPPVIGLAKRRC